MKKIFALLMTVTLLVSSLLVITSCGDNKDDKGDTGSVTYTVRLVNPDGTAVENVVVKLVKDGVQKGLQKVDAEGKVKFTVDKGNYDLELIPVSSFKYGCDPSVLKIMADSKETVINFFDIPTGSDEDGMKGVSDGHYLVELAPEGLSYFIFTAEERGIYELYATVGDKMLDVGYYGSPHYIFEENQLPVVDGRISLEIRKTNLASATSVATPYLIGIKGDGAEHAFLHIVKTDKTLEYNAQEMDWVDYNPSKSPSPQQIGYDNVDVITTDLDITDPHLTVVLGADGYYRLGNADGPRIYVRITTPSRYIAAFKDVNESGQLCRYYYNGDKVVMKEHYGVAMNAYIAAADEQSGLYPLDEGLEHIIKNTGEHLGWWNEGAMNYLFSEVDEAKDVAWLFACCTIERVSTGVTGGAPVIMSDEGKLLMSAGESVRLTYTASRGESAVFSALPSDAYITVGEETYTLKDGRITVFFAEGVNDLIISVDSGEDLVIKYKIEE